nr:reverse transcriptase domain-containing protein [Tanacetum cinerariifolium]
MAGPIERGGPEGTDDREETLPPLTKEQIEGHVETETQGHTVVKGNEVMDEDLIKPFKEARRTPFTRRIIEFVGPEYKMLNNIKLYDGTTDPKDHLSRFADAANSGEWPMPVWCRMFQQTLDGSARGWFEHLTHDSINEWAELREAFAASSECTKLGKSISTFDHGLCDFGLPSQPSNFLETCWVLFLLGYGSSGGGIKSLPSGLKGWGRHVMGLEALAGKRCSRATVGLKSGKEGKGFWTWQC